MSVTDARHFLTQTPTTIPITASMITIKPSEAPAIAAVIALIMESSPDVPSGVPVAG